MWSRGPRHEEMTKVLTIPKMSRADLIKIAKASPCEMTPKMKIFLFGLESLGQYTEATEDEMEEFDELLDEMEGWE